MIFREQKNSNIDDCIFLWTKENRFCEYFWQTIDVYVGCIKRDKFGLDYIFIPAEKIQLSSRALRSIALRLEELNRGKTNDTRKSSTK